MNTIVAISLLIVVLVLLYLVSTTTLRVQRLEAELTNTRMQYAVDIDKIAQFQKQQFEINKMIATRLETISIQKEITELPYYGEQGIA